MQIIKGNYVLVVIVKYWLNFTKAENENQYLTDLTDNISLENVSVSTIG